jgi:hypothetical protein
MTANNARSIVEISVLGFAFVCLALLVFAFRDGPVKPMKMEQAAWRTSAGNSLNWTNATANPETGCNGRDS